jgi:abortive infection bacteriophage resistance protein
MEYQKPPLTYSEQLDLLLDRGLEIENKAEALHCLKNISYYRLSAYFLPLSMDKFRKNQWKNSLKAVMISSYWPSKQISQLFFRYRR